MANTAEIMSKGIRCLIDNIGVIETEQFISIILREQFDYTKWQREHYDGVSPDEFFAAAKEYDKANPFTGKAKRI